MGKSSLSPSFLFILDLLFFQSIPQPQDDFVALTAMVAVGIGSVTADLQDIPNGPIRFMVCFISFEQIYFCRFSNERMIQQIEHVVMMHQLHGHGELSLKIHRIFMHL